MYIYVTIWPVVRQTDKATGSWLYLLFTCIGQDGTTTTVWDKVYRSLGLAHQRMYRTTFYHIDKEKMHWNPVS